MNTGIETWNLNLLDIGPMYPFVGSEMLLSLVGIALWFIWHFLQAGAENHATNRQHEELSKPGALSKEMDKGNH